MDHLQVCHLSVPSRKARRRPSGRLVPERSVVQQEHTPCEISLHCDYKDGAGGQENLDGPRVQHHNGIRGSDQQDGTRRCDRPSDSREHDQRDGAVGNNEGEAGDDNDNQQVGLNDQDGKSKQQEPTEKASDISSTGSILDLTLPSAMELAAPATDHMTTDPPSSWSTMSKPTSAASSNLSLSSSLPVLSNTEVGDDSASSLLQQQRQPPSLLPTVETEQKVPSEKPSHECHVQVHCAPEKAPVGAADMVEERKYVISSSKALPQDTLDSMPPMLSVGDLWNSRVSAVVDQHHPIFRPPSLQPASLHLPNFSAIDPPSSSNNLQQQTTQSSQAQLGKVTSACTPTSNSRLQPPGVGLTSTPLRCYNHMMVPDNPLSPSSSDLQHSLGSALSMTDLIMSDGEVIIPGPPIHPNSPSTDTQRENGPPREKGMKEAWHCPPLLDLVTCAPEPLPSQPHKEMGLQDLYPSVDAFLTQFGSTLKPPMAQTKPNPSSGPPMLLSLARQQPGEQHIPTVTPPPPPLSTAFSPPLLLCMPPDPTDPPLHHPSIPATHVPCTFFHQNTSKTRPSPEWSLPQIPVRPFIPVFAPPPTSQPGHTLPALILEDPLSLMQQKGFQLLNLPQLWMTNRSVTKDGRLKDEGEHGQKKSARCSTLQKKTTVKDPGIHRSSSGKASFRNKATNENQAIDLDQNQARKGRLREDTTLSESLERVLPSRKRVSRKVKLVVLNTAPEIRLASPKAHAKPASPPPNKMVEVGTSTEQEREEKIQSRNDAPTNGNLATALILGGTEDILSKNPEETSKKAVSVQVEMTHSPSTRSAEVQTDLPHSLLLPSPQIPSPTIFTTHPMSPSPSPDGIPPTSPANQQGSREGNVDSILECAGHQYLSVTDVEEAQEETLVEDPVQMEEDANSPEVPVLRESIPVVSKVISHQESQTSAVSAFPCPKHSGDTALDQFKAIEQKLAVIETSALGLQDEFSCSRKILGTIDQLQQAASTSRPSSGSCPLHQIFPLSISPLSTTDVTIVPPSSHKPSSSKDPCPQSATIITGRWGETSSVAGGEFWRKGDHEQMTNTNTLTTKGNNQRFGTLVHELGDEHGMIVQVAANKKKDRKETIWRVEKKRDEPHPPTDKMTPPTSRKTLTPNVSLLTWEDPVPHVIMGPETDGQAEPGLDVDIQHVQARTRSESSTTTQAKSRLHSERRIRRTGKLTLQNEQRRRELLTAHHKQRLVDAQAIMDDLRSSSVCYDHQGRQQVPYIDDDRRERRLGRARSNCLSVSEGNLQKQLHSSRGRMQEERQPKRRISSVEGLSFTEQQLMERIMNSEQWERESVTSFSGSVMSSIDWDEVDSILLERNS